jgi:nucleotide-binding universal stress UspA family protein
LAQEHSHILVFLFVIDTTSLRGADEGLRRAVREELRWLGLTLLLIARKRADSAQIDSEIIIREGVVRDEIINFINERSADLLLLGAPRGTTDTAFGDDLIEQFAHSIQTESGVAVEIVRPESVMENE